VDRVDSLRQLEQEMGVVVRRLKRVIGERARAVHADLQPAAYLMLTHVEAHGPVRASALAETFDVDKGAVSRQVNHLIDLGLLSGERDPEDGRATLLSVTAEGVRRLAEVIEHRRALLDQRLGDWSADDLAAFVDDLSRYNAALESAALDEADSAAAPVVTGPVAVR